MNKKTFVLGAVLSVMSLAGGYAVAQLPAENINPRVHPNLAAAQDLSRRAFERITAAQQANEYDMDGHAAKAKELLDKANEELRKAATDANKNHR